MSIRVFYFLALLLLSAPIIQVVRCQSESHAEGETVVEGGELGIVGDDVQDYSGGSFSPAPVVVAGEVTELLVGLKHEECYGVPDGWSHMMETGESNLNIIAVQASVHLPYDHKLLVQNLSSQAFNNASVPPSTQATFPYMFAVSKFLQAGTFDLVEILVYEIEQQPYQSTFYNGTIEVTEAGGPLSVESVFLFSVGVAQLVLFGLWARSQITQFSKKTKRAAKVEVRTATTDSSMDEWLEGTAYTQSNKSRKKK